MNMRTLQRVIGLVVLLIPAGCMEEKLVTVQSQKERNWLEADPTAVSAAEPMDAPRILPETHFAAGQLFEAQGQIEKAIGQYRLATVVNHEYAAAYNRLGILLGRVGRHADAETALRRAVELRPGDPLLRNNLGFQYALAGRLSDAEAELANAVQLRPDFARAYINLGLVLSRQERYRDALAAFRSAVPEEDAFYNLGLMFQAQHRYRDAADAFEHVLTLDPGSQAARQQLGLLQPRLALASALEPTVNLKQWPAVRGHRPAAIAVAAPTARQGGPVAPPVAVKQPVKVQQNSGTQTVLVGAETVVSRADAGAVRQPQPPVVAEQPPEPVIETPATCTTPPVAPPAQRGRIIEAVPVEEGPSVTVDRQVDAIGAPAVVTEPAARVEREQPAAPKSGTRPDSVLVVEAVPLDDAEQEEAPGRQTSLLDSWSVWVDRAVAVLHSWPTAIARTPVETIAARPID